MICQGGISIGFFDMFSIGRKKEERPKKTGSHGSHWDTLVEGDEAIHKCVTTTLETPELKERNPGDPMELTGWFRGGEVGTCVITGTMENVHQLISAYPFIPKGTVHEVTVDGIEEWANGCEAQVLGKIQDARIAFFDTLYFRDKCQYPPGKPYRIALAGTAYSIRPSVLDPIRFDDGMVREYDPSFCGYIPWSRGDIDDIEFNAVIREVSTMSYEGQKISCLTVPLCRINFRGEMQEIEIPVYATERTLDGYIPQVGDRIAGFIWLQGRRV